MRVAWLLLRVQLINKRARSTIHRYTLLYVRKRWVNRLPSVLRLRTNARRDCCAARVRVGGRKKGGWRTHTHGRTLTAVGEVTKHSGGQKGEHKEHNTRAATTPLMRGFCFCTPRPFSKHPLSQSFTIILRNWCSLPPHRFVGTLLLWGTVLLLSETNSLWYGLYGNNLELIHMSNGQWRVSRGFVLLDTDWASESVGWALSLPKAVEDLPPGGGGSKGAVAPHPYRLWII